MNTPNDRLEFLKWVNAHFKKVERLHMRLCDLADEVSNYPHLQDVGIHAAHSVLNHLEDRLNFLNHDLDSAYFVATGEMRVKDKKGDKRE